MQGWRRQLGAALVVLAEACALAAAGEARVTMQVSSRETYVGVPVSVWIIIENAESHDEPVFPNLPDARVVPPTSPRRSSQYSNVNGVVSQSVTDGYEYQVTPLNAGRLTIPPIEVTADGKKYQTQPIEIVVTKSETGDLLLVDVVGKRESLYVGEPLAITLQVWLRPYSDRKYNVKLSEADMWGRIDVQASDWGVFQDPLQELFKSRRRPVGTETLRKDSEGNDRSYYLYKLDTTIWPQRPGKLDVGAINIVVSYPTQLARDDFMPFSGGMTISKTRPLAAQVTVPPIEIKPTPTDGRPADFQGAVGRYQIAASATPTDVAVGEPITLTLTVRGVGQLETLLPPALPDLPDLSRDFKVPTEPLAGEVQGDRKVFTQTLRAKADTVTAIPPIPFTYFDPQSERFVTLQTEPISLTVKPAEKMSAAEIVEAAGGDRAVHQSLTTVSGGILANYTDADGLLSQQAFAPGWPSAAALGAPPLVFAAGWLAQRRRQRLRDDPNLARRRSARRVALREIEAATSADGMELPARVAAALGGYVADRCSLPPGGLTRMEVVEQLTRRGVSEAVVENVASVLQECESLQYAPSDPDTASDLSQQAILCIQLLERERGMSR